MRLPQALSALLVFAVALSPPASAKPAQELACEDLAKSYMRAAGFEPQGEKIDFGAFTEASFVHGRFGIFDLRFPVRSVTEKKPFEQLKELTLALLDAQEAWIGWVEPAAGKQKDARANLKTLRKWIEKQWSPAAPGSIEDGARDLFVILEAKEKELEAGKAFAAFMGHGELLGLGREAAVFEPIFLIPTRKEFVEFACFAGLAFPHYRSNYWHSGVRDWTNFYLEKNKILALEYSAPNQNAGRYEEGMSMNYRSPSGMAQQVVQLAANSMFDNYFGDRIPAALASSLAVNLVIEVFEQCDTRADGDLRSRRAEAREFFVPGGDPDGGELPMNLADSRWRVDRGTDHFVRPLRNAQKAGVEETEKRTDKIRHFQIQDDSGRSKMVVDGPYFGSAAAESEIPPSEFFTDHVEFLRAYRCCFIWWLQTKGGGSSSASAKSFGHLLRNLATSGGAAELESVFETTFDGKRLSSSELSNRKDLEGKFLIWLSKQ